MAVIASHHGILPTLGAWSPGAFRRALAATPKAVREAVRRGEAVPAPRFDGDRRRMLRLVLAGDEALRGEGDRHAACPNLRVRMTGCAHNAPGGVRVEASGEVEATSDPCDRAHREYRGELLANGRAAMHATPRAYHAMYMVGPRGRRVSVETAIERVEASAHEHGLHRGPSMGEAVAGVLVRADTGQVRTAVRGVKLSERYGESASERAEAAAMAEHERAVRAILLAGGGQ